MIPWLVYCFIDDVEPDNWLCQSKSQGCSLILEGVHVWPGCYLSVRIPMLLYRRLAFLRTFQPASHYRGCLERVFFFHHCSHKVLFPSSREKLSRATRATIMQSHTTLVHETVRRVNYSNAPTEIRVFTYVLFHQCSIKTWRYLCDN